MADLQHLFQPITLGSLTLANRVVMLPMALGYAESGKPTERMIRFLSERAVGGCGVICTPFSIFPVGDTALGYMGLDASSDEYIKPAKQLADAIHGYGVPIIGQLNTLTIWRKDKSSQLEVVGPSPFVARPRHHVPRELTHEEIRLYIEQHGQAARRLREAGYDAVEVLGGIGNIICRFISPVANQRSDEYGGNFENRMRLPLEIIEEIRKETGGDYPVLWRYSGHEFLEGGYDVDGAIAIGKVLKDAGIRWLNIQVGWHDSPVPLVTKEVPQGGFVYISETIRKAVDIPVVTSYRITDPVMADSIIREGKADLIGLARALISDPEWVVKAKQHKLKEINRCICCCRCIDQTVGAGKGLEICSVNARVGREIDSRVVPAEKVKKVLIVGSGPAGMESARVCKLRGHDVTVFEKESKTGGQLNIAKLPPDKYEISYLQDYLENNLRMLHVKIKTNVEVNDDLVAKESPDCVIIATGAHPLIPKIPGVDRGHVLTGTEVLAGKVIAGDKAVIIGGGLIGCEVSLFLAKQGKQVTILEMLPKMGMDIGASERFITINKLKKNGVIFETGAKVVQITGDKVIAIRNGEKFEIQADSVILATGMESNDTLREQITKEVSEVYIIGDCLEPRRIGEAIKEGFKTGLVI